MMKLLKHVESKSSLGGPKTRSSEKAVASVIYTGLLAVFVFLVGWAFAPGHTNNDTIDMFIQARTGVFHDWHSPIVSGIWFLVGGQPWVLALTLFVTLGGFAFFAYKLFRLVGFPHSTACIFAILTCYIPPVLGYLGCACKDTWVAVIFLGILFLSICYHQKPRLSIILLRNSACVVPILIRREFVFIVGLFLLLEFLFLKEFALHRRLVCLIASGLFVLVGYLGADGATRYFEHTARVHPEQFLYLSDLTDLSVAEDRTLIPAPFLHGNDLATIKKHYRSPDPSSVFWGEPQSEMVKFSTRAEEVSELQREWIRGFGTIRGEPYNTASRYWQRICGVAIIISLASILITSAYSYTIKEPTICS